MQQLVVSTPSSCPGICSAVELANPRTILLVEDEEFVRVVTAEALELEGYRVLIAKDPAEAIALCKARKEIDLLLTDVVMPGMNGKDLADRIARLVPDIRTIFMSGYSENVVVRNGSADLRYVYLQKPFTLDSLLSRVDEMLHSRMSAVQ